METAADAASSLVFVPAAEALQRLLLGPSATSGDVENALVMSTRLSRAADPHRQPLLLELLDQIFNLAIAGHQA